MRSIQHARKMTATAAVIFTAILGQNLAFAYDAVGFSAQASNRSSVYEWLEHRMRVRWEKASPEKRNRIMTGYQTRGNKILAKLLQTSDETFQEGYRKIFNQSVNTGPVKASETDPDVAISKEEETDLLGDGLPPQETAQAQVAVVAPAFTRTQAIEKVTSALQQIQDWKNRQQSSNSTAKMNRAPAQAELFADIGILLVLIMIAAVVGFVLLFFSAVLGAIVLGSCLITWVLLTVITG